jgi:hypothetical protein
MRPAVPPARGLECLQNYRREKNEKLGEFRSTPVHDWASHGADAFGLMCVAHKPPSGTAMKQIDYSNAGIV